MAVSPWNIHQNALAGERERRVEFTTGDQNKSTATTKKRSVQVHVDRIS